MLQTDVNANKGDNYNKTAADVLKCVQIDRTKARDVDIRVVVRFMNKSKNVKIKEYKKKKEK